MVAVIALVISASAFAFTLVTYLRRQRLDRVAATVKFWADTAPLRLDLRRRIPYEHTDAFKDFVARVHEEFTDPSRTAAESDEVKDLKAYLSLFETLGAAVNAGVFDLDVIGRIDGPRIVALTTSPDLKAAIAERARIAYAGAGRAKGQVAVPGRMYAELTAFGDRLSGKYGVEHRAD